MQVTAYLRKSPSQKSILFTRTNFPAALYRLKTEIDTGFSIDELVEEPTPEECHWCENDTAWETSCGELFIFTTDGPRENKFKYCSYCGGRLMIPVIVTDEE